MKLCKDCKFYRSGILNNFFRLFGEEFSFCVAPRATGAATTSPITGRNKKPKKTYCEVQRDFDFCCGPSARYFESKQ